MGLPGVGVVSAEEHPISLFENNEDSAEQMAWEQCHHNDSTGAIDQTEYESYFNC